MNARFWVYVNGGPVKLTLRPRQELMWSRGDPTEEGWSRESATWAFDGDYVYRRWETDGCDCDGRLSRYGGDKCSVDRLRFGREPYLSDSDPPGMWDGVIWPDWQDESRSQRDFSAEAMGY